MKTIKVQKLTNESFRRYGSFANFINPTTDACGDKNAPICFYRDMIQTNFGGVAPTFSTCRMMKRDFVIDAAEFHDFTGELCMPLDGDAICWFAPAGAAAEVPYDEIEAFYVPQGTGIFVHPGVWHHAAYAVEDKPLNVLICLPERTYRNDCVCMSIPADKQIKIEL